jgi:hypothetical protein
MWVFTTGGFVSAVEHRDDPTMTMVRARDKKSLEEMLSGIKKALEEGGKSTDEVTDFMKDMEIYAVPGDYKWRVVVPKSAYALFLMYEAMHYVNYSNFKSKLTATRGDKWHDAAMSVWNAMFKITDVQKTGNPDVDNPKSYTYYHGGGDDYAYVPTSFGGGVTKKGKPIGQSPSELAGKGSLADVDEGEEDWLGAEWKTVEDYYSADYTGQMYGRDTSYDWSSNGAHQRYYGTDYGKPMFMEDLEEEDFEDRDVVDVVPSGTNGYHTFSGKDYAIDGRGDIVNGEFFLDTELDGPTDVELERIQFENDVMIGESWELWDDDTEFNTITGETRARDKAVKSIHSMTDREFATYDNEM